jgi:hypothetical protein
VFSVAYVILPFSGTPPAEAIKASLAPSQRGLRAVLEGRPAYVHVDCDLLEPGIVPTEYGVPGGLSLEYLHDALRVIAGGEVVALEVAEFEAAWPARLSGNPAPLLRALSPLLGTCPTGPGPQT